jgi:MbtH protein
MNVDEREDAALYKVVVNGEGQYSIWPADREDALGWSDAGRAGTRRECLAYVEEVWTDMRPLSLRGETERDARARGGAKDNAGEVAL